MSTNIYEIQDKAGDLPDGDIVLSNVYAFLGRFVAYPSEHCQVAHTLWIAHTHLMSEWESTPRLAFLSPEPGSGKTRALEVTELLVPRPVCAINATPAYLFRKVSDSEGLPTILFDEIDTIFGAKAKDNEEVRGVLNAGHRRGAMAGRCVVRGKEIVTEEFPAYCAAAVAGLGILPDTILSRSIVITMRRRAPSEYVEPYRRRFHAPEGQKVRDELAVWAEYVHSKLAYSDMPDGVEDRDADKWESLLAVADAAGGDWASLARAAAVALVTQSRESTPSLGLRLLTDIKAIFGVMDSMATTEIITALVEMDEAPWGDLRGRAIDSRKLANLLRPYGVRSRPIRRGGAVDRGYTREDLHDPWTRYLAPVLPPGSVTSVTSATEAKTPNENVTDSVQAGVTHLLHETPVNCSGVADVTDVTHSEGARGDGVLL